MAPETRGNSGGDLASTADDYVTGFVGGNLAAHYGAGPGSGVYASSTMGATGWNAGDAMAQADPGASPVGAFFSMLGAMLGDS